MAEGSWRVLATALLLGVAVPARAAVPAPNVPAYDHIFLMIQENHGFPSIIGNPHAPNINRLAAAYGLATSYFSVADPSAPNYVAMLGGDFFGIADDNPYYTRTQNAPSLMSQMTDAGMSWRGYFQGMPYAGMSWRGYFQGMPYAGYREICFPGRCNGIPDFDPYYASKHNGMPYFRSVQAPSEIVKMQPLAALTHDLAASPPRFGYIVADQCHDMHGSPPWCGDSGNYADTNDNQLVARGDAFVGATVGMITSAPFWNAGNNAIVVTWDEGNGTTGCCDANPGTGRVATIVIASHGPRGLRDDTPYNHYSLLQTIERAFGLGCVGYACDTANVTPMAKLFAVAGP